MISSGTTRPSSLSILFNLGEIRPAQKLHPLHLKSSAPWSVGPRFSTMTTSMRRLRRLASRRRWIAKNEPAGPPPTMATRSLFWRLLDWNDISVLEHVNLLDERRRGLLQRQAA